MDEIVSAAVAALNVLGSLCSVLALGRELLVGFRRRRRRKKMMVRK